jgi:translation initiation factor 2 subunit 3
MIEEIDQELQPLVVISLLGRVSNGKSSLVKALTGINPMKHSNELKKNMSIRLGYINIKLYKCQVCPTPHCFSVNKECERCKKPNVLMLHFSVCDVPGHCNLLETALSGITGTDFCLLLTSAECTIDTETNEHYKAIKMLGLNDSTIVLQNKLDLVSKDRAMEDYEKTKELYDVKYVIPTCVQFNFGIKYLMQFMIESIPNPINDKLKEKINKPLKGSIIRSFDINKPGIDVSKMTGAVIGSIIKHGHIKINDKIKIIPGIIMKNGNNIPIEAYVTSLKTGSTDLQIAYPGGLIGMGLSIDPTLAKEDRLVGNFIVKDTDEENKIFKSCTIEYSICNDKVNIRKKDICNVMLSSMKRKAQINWVNKDAKQLNFKTQISMAGKVGDIIIITKSNHIELCGKLILIE